MNSDKNIAAVTGEVREATARYCEGLVCGAVKTADDIGVVAYGTKTGHVCKRKCLAILTGLTC